MDVTSKTIHKEVITNSWPSALSGISWLPSNDSFIYTHIPNIDSNSPKYIKNTVSVVFELTKTSKNKPVLLSKKNNPLLNINSSDFPIVYSIENYNNYLFGRIGGARSFDDYFYTSNFTSASERVHWKPLYSKKDMVSDFKILDNHFIFLSAKNASNFKLCRTPLSNPNFSSPEVIVKEENNAVITDFVVNSQGVYFVRTKNGVDAKVFEYNNEKITELKLPEAAGEIYVYSKGEKFNDLWIKTWGWIKKGQRYKYKAETKEFISESLNLIKENEQHDNIVVEEIEIKSRDGEMVPLSIMYKKNIKRDGNNSLLIQGYGAFGYSITPYPERIMLNWVQNGGVFAVAHVRGGGEKGEFWHKSGFKNNKFNTWRDLIDCTQFLISNNYTNSKKVAVISSSAGGIMIG
ncbi:MAG: prolyl oligopeptidase, partial [Flavobacteriaceae bacterium]